MLKIFYTIILFFACNILVWYQLNSQLVWDWAKGTKSMWTIGFAISMFTFPLMTYLYLGEVITLKIGISILLATVILILQLL